MTRLVASASQAVKDVESCDTIKESGCEFKTGSHDIAVEHAKCMLTAIPAEAMLVWDILKKKFTAAVLPRYSWVFHVLL